MAQELRIPLNVVEQLKFVKIIFDARQAGMGWRLAIKKANNTLPKNKKMSDGIDHPSKLKWMIPMYEALEAQLKPVEKKAAKLPLNDAEKKLFAKRVFDAHKKNPEQGYSNAICEANKLMPSDRRVGETVTGLNHLVWLKPILDKLESEVETMKMPLVTIKRLPLNEEERITFAKNFFEFKKANPEAGSGAAIRAANHLMPVDRQVGAAIDSVKQISWIIPLLEQLENPSKVQSNEIPPEVQSRWACKLSDKEKEEFAEIVYRLRKGGATWTHCMKEANSFMPEGHKVASVNPSGVPWLQRALVKLEEADTGRVVIDHRGTLPKAEEPYEIPRKQRGGKIGGNKLFLNDEDKEHFAELVYQFRLHHSGWGWQRILDEANMEMPAHKRREHMPPNPSQLPWLPSLLDKIGNRPSAPAYMPPVVEVVEAPKVETASAVGMEDAMINMMASMMKQFMPALMQNPETQKKLQAAMLSPGVSQPIEQASPQPQKKKVVVVGLLAIQTQETQRDFGRVFNFKFIDANTPSQQIKESARDADIAIIMTKFTSHSTQSALRQHPGFTFCNGNSSALKNLLEDKLTRMRAGQ